MAEQLQKHREALCRVRVILDQEHARRQLRDRFRRREGHESLEGTVAAPHACEASGQQTAAEEFPELLDDESGEAAAVRLCVHGGEELGEVSVHDAVQHPRRR